MDKKEWIEVKDLKVGDRVLLSDGKEVAISGIRSYNVEPTKVYNFEVADNHTYFVGEDGVLVHNYVFVIPVIGAGIMKCAQNAACSRAVATGTAVLGTAVSGIFSGNTFHRAEGDSSVSGDAGREDLFPQGVGAVFPNVVSDLIALEELGNASNGGGLPPEDNEKKHRILAKLKDYAATARRTIDELRVKGKYSPEDIQKAKDRLEWLQKFINKNS